MKTYQKFIALIIIACLASIVIFYKVDKAKPATKVPDILVTQNKTEEAFLKKTDYTIEDPKVILDPYDISPLTALIIFETKDLTAPTVTIKGKDENSTFTHTFTPAKKHILPIYGLYADTDNEVTIKINKTEKTIHIKTKSLPEDFVTPTNVEADKSQLDNDLYFFTPASVGYTCAFDVNGDVRWYLKGNYVWDIKRLDNGNLLLSSNRLLNPPYYTTGLMEMDLTGKVYYEYSLPGGYHHDAYEMPNGNLLVASDDFTSGNGTVEDYIVEIDRKTGDIVKEIDLKNILPTEEGKSESWTEYDWFHNNSVWYDEKTNSITLSGRHQDAVVNINYDTEEINWIIGDPEGWDKKYQKYFFKIDGDNEFDWQYAQHAAMILPNGNVFIFDNGNNRSKNKDSYLKAEDNYSRGVIYQINNENKTIKQVWQYGKELGSSFYSPYISDVDYFDDNHYLIHSGGISSTDGKPNNTPASFNKNVKLNSVTVELKDDEEIFKIELPTNNYRSEKMSLYANNIYKTGKGIRLGTLGETKATGKNHFIIFPKRIDKTYKSHNIKVTKESDRLVFTGTFKKTDKVEIILDNLVDKKTYPLIISKKPYTAMCIDVFNEQEEKDGISVTKYINNEGMNGKYYIYIKINGKTYDIDRYVTY